MATRTTRTTRTRAETKAALDDVTNRTRSREAISGKDAELITAQNESVRKAVADLSVEKALQQVTGTNLQVSKALTSVSEQLVEQTQLLETVKQAVRLEKEELERLHGVDVVAASIEDLLAQHGEKQAELVQSRAETETEWKRTQEEYARAEKERIADQIKARVREEADYNYALQQKRKLAEDQWNEQMRLVQRNENERMGALEKVWAQREADLAAREGELTDLRTQVENFPQALDKEKKAAVAIAENSIKREFEHKIQLIQKDYEANARIAATELTTANAQLEVVKQQNADLLARLAQAETKVSEIARQAIEGASGRQALAEITNFAQNQSNGSNTKSRA